MSNDLVAPAGSKVLCPNGHPLCELSHDLRNGTMNWGALLVKWTQPKPLAGQAEATCVKCGAIYFSNGVPNVIFRPAKEARRLPW